MTKASQPSQASGASRPVDPVSSTDVPILQAFGIHREEVAGGARR